MKKTVLLIVPLLLIGLAWGQDCTADDGTEGVELWGECYSIENTTQLNLSNNGLTGSIPPEIGNLTNLEYLNLRSNQLTGEIPPEIGTLTNLNYLDLRVNQFHGEIPPEIGNLTNLTTLKLYDNQLTGEIPSEIWTLTNLEYLSIDGNQLTGTISPEIGELTNLEKLWLSVNTFTGTIPSEIWTLTNLETLGLDDNQLTGEIPPEIGNLTNLEILRLHTNQLTGSIPETLCDLSNLTWSLEDSSYYVSTLFGNQLCPPYPSCIEDYVGEQDTTNCNQGSVTVDYQSGWNLVGLPLEVEDASYSNLFPESINGTLYSFGEGYLLDSTLVQGEGYWLRFNNAGSTTIDGTPINELTISLNEDWNLVSGLSEDISIYSVSDPDSIIIPGTLYGFNEGYLETDLFVPGKGYWLRANNSGNIILTSE